MKTQSLKLILYFFVGLLMIVVLGARFASVFNTTSNTNDYFNDRMSIPDSISIATKYVFTDTCLNNSVNRVDAIYFLYRDRMGTGGYEFEEAGTTYFKETNNIDLSFQDSTIIYYKKPINRLPLANNLLECHFQFNTPIRYLLIDTLVNGQLHKLLRLPGSTIPPGRIL